ncbi:hypothetical protein AVEN_86046-1 [Araneus ventricosus]|uniref:Uncharacterized protein n=1 Tax=Araneus ventricosus TaxID=182803 RepID=A0A4Y2DFH4_ARAVE|nr:hypothetical protein AVEN_86046-1 [Araneus ventricosus]
MTVELGSSKKTYVLSSGKRHAYLPNRCQIVCGNLLTCIKFGQTYKKKKCKEKLQDVFKRRQQEFISNLDNLFDIAQADALQLMKIEEDRMFLQRQREPGRPGGVDKKLAD